MEKIQVAHGLNIIANPHPPGIYITLLRNASRGIAQARGSDFATITSPRKYAYSEDEVYTGRILVWTDIDLRGRWLDLSKQEDLSAEIKARINIPPNARPNYRTFSYVFIAKYHQFWFESRNDLNNTIGPTTARRIISTLIERANQDDDSPETYVSIIPEENAVAEVLKLPYLRTLSIRVNRPNPDASSPEARQRVFAKLDEERVHRLDIKLTKSSKAPRLLPSEETKELAEVGADTGFARSEARDDDGQKIVRSTADMPKTVHLPIDENGSFVRRLLSVLFL